MIENAPHMIVENKIRIVRLIPFIYRLVQIDFAFLSNDVESSDIVTTVSLQSGAFQP